MAPPRNLAKKVKRESKRTSLRIGKREQDAILMADGAHRQTLNTSEERALLVAQDSELIDTCDTRRMKLLMSVALRRGQRFCLTMHKLDKERLLQPKHLASSSGEAPALCNSLSCVPAFFFFLTTHQ